MHRRTWITVGMLGLLAVAFATTTAVGVTDNPSIRISPLGVIHTPTPTVQARFLGYNSGGTWSVVTYYPEEISILLDGEPLPFTRLPASQSITVTVSAPVTEPLSEGLHSVVASSSVGVDWWTFEYQADQTKPAPAITDVWPLGDTSRYSWDGTARFAIAEGRIDTATADATITVDGVDHAATVSGSYFVTSALGTSLGAHEVTATATDDGGTTVSRHWEFVQNLPPRIESVSPAHQSFSNSTTSTVVAEVSDLVGGIEPDSVEMRVNGAAVPADYRSVSETRGVLTYVPSRPFSSDTTVAVVLTVRDVHGSVASKSWYFEVTDYPESVVPDVSQNITCRACHGEFSQVHLNEPYPNLTYPALGSPRLSHYLPANAVLSDAYSNCIYCHQQLDTVVNDPGVFTDHQYDSTVPMGTNLYEMSRGRFCEICHIPPSPPLENGYSSSWKWRAHGRSSDFTSTQLPLGARVTAPREPMDCTYCHQSGSVAPYQFGPHDTAKDHTLELGDDCLTCHSRILSREHAVSGRADGGGAPITCQTCHVDGSEQVRAVSGKQWLGGTDRWEASAFAYQSPGTQTVDPWSYTENGQAVPVTKVKIHLKGTGRAILNAFYNGAWNQVLLVPARDASSSYGVVANPDKVIELAVPGATAFRWTIAYTKGYNSANGIKAGLTVMETSAGRPEVVCGTCHTVFDGHRGAHEEDVSGFCAGPGCHSANLVTEHQTNRGLTCRTCHESARSEVADAIAAGDGSCDACHDSAAGHAHPASRLTSSTVEFAEQCSECHATDVLAEHAKSTSEGHEDVCLSCHGSTDPSQLAAIAAGDTSCDACHDVSVAHRSQHVTRLDGRCTKCHGPALDSGHGATSDSTATVQATDCAGCHQGTARAAAVAFSRSACGDCHQIGHQQSFAASLSPDVYLDPRFEWSRPLPCVTFAGESWMPAEAAATDGSVVVATRAQVSVTDAWDVFRQTMIARGWTAPSSGPAAGAANFSATLSRGQMRCKIVLWAGDSHAASATGEHGTRAEIIWWVASP